MGRQTKIRFFIVVKFYIWLPGVFSWAIIIPDFCRVARTIFSKWCFGWCESLLIAVCNQ